MFTSRPLAVRTVFKSMPLVTAPFIPSTIWFKTFSLEINPPVAAFNLAIIPSICVWIDDGVPCNVCANCLTPAFASFAPLFNAFAPLLSPWDFFVSSNAALAVAKPDDKSFAPLLSLPAPSSADARASKSDWLNIEYFPNNSFVPSE